MSDYRAAALKLLPWICARCAREFSGKRVRELTVHHKDGDHHHNPPDGSNWELLCVYCHENEHARVVDNDGRAAQPEQSKPSTYKALQHLKEKLKKR
jgi:cytochrome c553